MGEVSASVKKIMCVVYVNCSKPLQQAVQIQSLVLFSALANFLVCFPAPYVRLFSAKPEDTVCHVFRSPTFPQLSLLISSVWANFFEPRAVFAVFPFFTPVSFVFRSVVRRHSPFSNPFFGRCLLHFPHGGKDFKTPVLLFPCLC